jgi:hypothetical protein
VQETWIYTTTSTMICAISVGHKSYLLLPSQVINKKGFLAICRLLGQSELRGARNPGHDSFARCSVTGVLAILWEH